MLTLEEAQAKILAAVPSPACETVPLSQAHERVAAERVEAAVDLPGFDNSSMDGYAVRAGDVAGASGERPVKLRLAGEAAAGLVFPGQLSEGETVRVFTGSALPAGADAVVMQEDTRSEGDQVFVLDAAKPWENVRFRGEDVKRGAVLIEPGEIINAGRVGLLAATGASSVKVGRRPVVGLLATGSELREAGQPLGAGQIYESNRVALAALVKQAGGEPKVLPLVPDDLEATKRALAEALAACDVLITSGGVSVGAKDFVKPAMAAVGGELGFWKVAMRPGRPFVFGRWGNKFLFGLPGNPVSAVVTFLLLVRPALWRWAGAKDVSEPGQTVVLSESLSNSGERRHFMRVRVDESGRAASSGLQASHALSSLAAANGFVDVPPKATLAAGTSVRVLRWG